MDILKTAVIGIGNMGFAHASCIANGEIDGMRLTAVCDTDIRKTKIFKEKHPKIKTFSDYKDLINSNIELYNQLEMRHNEYKNEYVIKAITYLYCILASRLFENKKDSYLMSLKNEYEQLFILLYEVFSLL